MGLEGGPGICHGDSFAVIEFYKIDIKEDGDPGRNTRFKGSSQWSQQPMILAGGSGRKIPPTPASQTG